MNGTSVRVGDLQRVPVAHSDQGTFARPRVVSELAAWAPRWSLPAALRGVRAGVVVPGTFAIALEVIGKPQMALFVAFGGIATLVMTGFAGGRCERLIAHLVLAAMGTLLLTLGTAVSLSVALAAVVTLLVTFAVFFVGVIGPMVEAGTTAVLLVYVLAVASPATIGTVPDRLAGWWLASVAGTIAVLMFAADTPGERLRNAAARLAAALADELEAMLRGDATDALRQNRASTRDDLFARFNASSLRLTNRATRDQALANAIDLLGWCGVQVDDMVIEQPDLSEVAQTDRDIVAACADVLRASGRVLTGDVAHPDPERLEKLQRQSAARLDGLRTDNADFDRQADAAFQANSLSLTARAIAAYARQTQRAAGSERLATALPDLFLEGSTQVPHKKSQFARISHVVAGHGSLRSIWLVNSVRAAFALAAAVAVADLSSVQHGFWVVLGALAVLHMTATSTSATALRALAGTAVGIGLGGALVFAIGASPIALWIALPIALFVAAYVPGNAPFAVGQAAFTVFLLVEVSLLAPSGWRVGLVRVEDIAIGAAVSVLIGALFWPRGVSAIVADDLASAYRAGARYLRDAIERVSAAPTTGSDAAMAAATASMRLDDSMRAFISEKGAKHIPWSELWRLVGGVQRLRQTATAAAVLPREQEVKIAALTALSHRGASIETWYVQLAALLERPRAGAHPTLTAPRLDDPREPTPRSHDLIWLHESVDHLVAHLGELIAPAQHVAEIRRRPWWR